MDTKTKRALTIGAVVTLIVMLIAVVGNVGADDNSAASKYEPPRDEIVPSTQAARDKAVLMADESITTGEVIKDTWLYVVELDDDRKPVKRPEAKKDPAILAAEQDPDANNLVLYKGQEFKTWTARPLIDVFGEPAYEVMLPNKMGDYLPNLTRENLFIPARKVRLNRTSLTEGGKTLKVPEYVCWYTNNNPSDAGQYLWWKNPDEEEGRRWSKLIMPGPQGRVRLIALDVPGATYIVKNEAENTELWRFTSKECAEKREVSFP